jgi:HAD superfamily hydrolase (TIGR01509 family)
MSQFFYQAIIFDCDGVLVDTERLSHLAWQTKLAERGLHFSFAELHQYFTGFTTQANLKKAEALFGIALPDDFSAQVKEMFWQKINEDLPVIPFVEETLKRINLPKAAATNALRKELDFKLKKTGLDRYFEHTVCCEDVFSPKPSPDIYLEAARRLGIAPRDCAVVEDSVAGVQAGVAADMTVFGFCRETDPASLLAAGATNCFGEMTGLPDLLAC